MKAEEGGLEKDTLCRLRPVVVVTNMGVYKFDENGMIYLETYHPSITVAKIKENCGFDLNITNVKGEASRPTYKELFVLREFVDPELIFFPVKTEYPPPIRKMIEG